MADVEATIHMCRLITERELKYWSGFVRFAHKSAVTNFALESELFTLTDFYNTRPYSWLVTVIGPNPENGSEMLVFDLSRDPDDLASLGDENLVTCLTSSPKPVRTMRTNAAPIALP